MKKLMMIFLLINSSILLAANSDWRQVFDADSALIVELQCNHDNECVFCANKTSGYSSVNFTDPFVIYSSDGGDTWDTLWTFTTGLYYDEETGYYLKSEGRIESFAFPNKKLIVLDMDSARFRRSTDLGKTWHSFEVDTTLKTFWGARWDDFIMEFYDENLGIIIPKNGFPNPDDSLDKRIYITTDGAETWNDLPLPEHLPGIISISTIFIFDENNFIFGCTTKDAMTSVLKTNDGGESWDFYPVKNDMPGAGLLHFTDSQTGYFTDFYFDNENIRHNVIMKTYNGGHIWNPVTDFIETENNGQVRFVGFWNNDIGYAAGPGNVYRTSNGGLSWEDIYEIAPECFDDYSPSDIEPLSEDKCLFTVREKEIWKYEHKGTSAQDPAAITGLNIFPNPAGDFLNIDMRDFEEMRIFNLFGEQVYFTDSFTNSIDISFMPKGYYNIIIITGGKNYYYNFIKM